MAVIPQYNIMLTQGLLLLFFFFSHGNWLRFSVYGKAKFYHIYHGKP